MTQILQDAYFPFFPERRRPMRKILPNASQYSGKDRFTKTVWILMMVMVFGAGSYLGQLI